jgi:hypothetical protein
MKRLVLAASLVLAATVGSADDVQRGPRYFFLERSYFWFANLDKEVLAAPSYYGEAERRRDDGDILFEAQPDPHLMLVNKLALLDLRDGTRPPALHGQPPEKKPFLPQVFGDRWVVSFSFKMRLRQLGGFSSPLRSPSFMPKLTFQRLSITRKKEGSFTPDNWIKVFGPQIIAWGHHSNGGAGCLSLEEIAPECSSAVPPERRTVNTQNGSFSTNYLRLGYFFLKGRSDGEREGEGGNWLDRSWSLGCWVELNPKSWGPGSIPEGQRALYGPARFGVTAELQRQFKLRKTPWNASLNPTYEYITFDHRPAPGSSPHRVVVDLSAVKDRGKLRGWGLAVRYYQGQDFNNLLFVRDIRRVQIGLVVDQQTRRLD